MVTASLERKGGGGERGEDEEEIHTGAQSLELVRVKLYSGTAL